MLCRNMLVGERKEQEGGVYVYVPLLSAMICTRETAAVLRRSLLFLPRRRAFKLSPREAGVLGDSTVRSEEARMGHVRDGINGSSCT